jgi:hypothetical protein
MKYRSLSKARAMYGYGGCCKDKNNYTREGCVIGRVTKEDIEEMIKDCKRKIKKINATIKGV